MPMSEFLIYALVPIAIGAVAVVLLAAFVHGPLGYVLMFLAAAFAAANVVGGYVVTDRMLQMFRKRPVPVKDETK